MLELLRQVIGEIGKYGLGHVTGRYYGHYMCIVTDNEDPMKTGCVRLYGMIFPGSTNDSSNPYDLWIPPKSNYVGNSSGQFFPPDRKSTRLNSSHLGIPYAVLCLKRTARPQTATLLRPHRGGLRPAPHPPAAE